MNKQEYLSDTEIEENGPDPEFKLIRQQLKQQELANDMYYSFKDFNKLRPNLFNHTSLYIFNKLVYSIYTNTISSELFKHNKNHNKVCTFWNEYKIDIKENYNLLSKYIKLPNWFTFDLFVAFCIKYSYV